MITLIEYITESAKSEKYGTLIHHIDINPNDDVTQIAKQLMDALQEVITKYKVVRISAVEEANRIAVDKVNARKEIKLKDAEKQIIKLMQSKPGILKRSPEKRQKWIDDKLKKAADEFDNSFLGRVYPKSVDFEDENIRWGWHQDIFQEHSYRQFSGMNRVAYIADCICSCIERGKETNDAWSHIKSIEFSTKSFIDNYPSIDIVPVFDEETEAKLADSVRKHAEYMMSMYASGRYMGD